MEGNYKMKNGNLTLGNYLSGSSFLANSFAIKSDIVSFYFKITHRHGNTTKYVPPFKYSHYPDSYMFQIAPKIFHLWSTHKSGWVPLHGLQIYFLQMPNGTQFAYVHPQTKFKRGLLESIWKTDFERFKKTRICHFQFVDKTTTLNATMHFKEKVMEVFVDGKHCLNFTIPDGLFHEPKAAIALVSYTYADTPVKLYINEAIISRLVSKAPIDHGHHFCHHKDKLKEHTHSHDHHYRKNISITNLFIKAVSL